MSDEPSGGDYQLEPEDVQAIASLGMSADEVVRIFSEFATQPEIAEWVAKWVAMANGEINEWTFEQWALRKGYDLSDPKKREYYLARWRLSLKLTGLRSALGELWRASPFAKQKKASPPTTITLPSDDEAREYLLRRQSASVPSDDWLPLCATCNQQFDDKDDDQQMQCNECAEWETAHGRSIWGQGSIEVKRGRDGR